ncbi:extracellular superoxide dismutase [Cu-Zn] [Octodon degus]|uniref:Superoxide dismutase [Cu-Zn] n=1 Tax=Octodon degus TaxID=10160 RepID=A0A6P6D4Q1_OCTDE|nr:extracellular superoxide dismutase [Cu-Zn] [Octodon degus]XP_023555062.1 extracellular superoxide dismutase [Cu-Zn] [Octodon degus]
MRALLCGCLLLAAGLAHALNSTDPEEPSPNVLEQIRDMHAKVMDIWKELVPRQQATGELHAVCRVQPSSKLGTGQPRVTGLVLFRQSAPEARLEAIFDLEGFPEDATGSRRAIHVHRFGDLSQGCDSTGPHYNPWSTPHPQHPGDFGNFVVRPGGRLWKYQAGLPASLAGPHSIVGRALVVHAGEDDMGCGDNPASLENGNAGPRLACCVVGLGSTEAWASGARELEEHRKRRRNSDCKTA